MPSFRAISMLFLAAASAVSALPTATDCGGDPSKTEPQHRATHSVVVGRAGLHFDPDNVVAEVHDIIEFHFTPRNHSVAVSSFAEPCKPLEGGAFAGFNFVTTEGQNPNVFQLEVTDTKPIWIYCPQQGAVTNGTRGISHCEAGMNMAVNQNFNSANTLANYRKAAAANKVSVIPPVVQGGKTIPNPNKLSGF